MFVIPVFDTTQTLAEMNKFLRSHKVVEVKRELVTDGSGSAYWCCSLHYIVGGAVSSIKGIKKERIDYREVLDEATFKVYAGLRDCRKKIGEQEALPLYAVFTNAELAKMAKLDEMPVYNLLKINGIGKEKAEKYGQRIIEM